MNKPLFRPEVFAHQRDNSHGRVLLTQPPKIRHLVGGTVLFVLILVVFAFFGHYTKKEHVAGYLRPSSGMIKVYAPQSGTVTKKKVSEGQVVTRGEVLLMISAERSTHNARDLHASLAAQLTERRDSLRTEKTKQDEIDELVATGISGRIASIETEIIQASDQLDLQSSRVNNVEESLKRYEKLLRDRFVSEIAVQQKRDELIVQRNLLSDLKRTVTALKREQDAAKLDLEASALKRVNNRSAYNRQISELDQQLTETDTRLNAILTAPADGIVTTILADLGQTVTPNTPVLSILPKGATLEAQLLVPTRAAGFLKTGQSVNLRYQAFPYQRFGHHSGSVTEVGRSVLLPNEASLPIAVQEPVYRITVRLAQQHIKAYGQDLPLQAGMLVDGDILVDRRSLIEWIFDPLLSISGRF